MRRILEAIFRFIAKPISVTFAILFVLVTILVLPLFNVERTLLNAGAYKRALAENGVYQQIPALAEAQMDAMKVFLANPDGTNTEELDLINNLTPEDWQRLLTLLLPPDEARTMIENLLDQVFAHINGEADTPRLSLVVLKGHLTGQAGKDSLQQLLNARPPCTEEQVAQIHSENADSAEQPVYCKPPQADLTQLISQWQAQLSSPTSGIPDEVSLKPLSGLFGEASPGNDPIDRLNTVRMIIRFSPLLPLTLLLLITLFKVRSLKDWFLWWGIPLIITGLIVTVIGLAILPLLNWAWANYILPQFPPALSAGITGLASNLAVSVARALATPITLEAAIIGLLGLAAIIVSFFVESKPRDPVSLKPQGAG